MTTVSPDFPALDKDTFFARCKAGTLTQDEAVAFALSNLADLFEAINGVRPAAAPTTPPHLLLVAWMPGIHDYKFFVRRSQETIEQANRARIKYENARAEVLQTAWQRGSAAGQANRVLANAKRSLQEALAHLETVTPAVATYDRMFGDTKPCECGHTYVEHFDPDTDTSFGCRGCPCPTWNEPLVVVE